MNGQKYCEKCGWQNGETYQQFHERWGWPLPPGSPRSMYAQVTFRGGLWLCQSHSGTFTKIRRYDVATGQPIPEDVHK